MKKLFFIIFLVSNLCASFELDLLCCEQEIKQEQSLIALQNPLFVDEIYQNNQYILQWSERNLKDFLGATKDKFLNYLFLDYNQDKIENLLKIIGNSNAYEQKQFRVQIDLLATDGFFSFAKDLSIGLIDQEQFQVFLNRSEIDLVWEKDPKVYHYAKDLSLALKTDMISALLQRYLPMDGAYRQLIKFYHQYGDMKFPKVDYGKLLKVGDYGYRASQLKAYLVQTGDLKDVDKEYIEFPTFDEKLKFALMNFQKRHYLKVTGELDRVTVLYIGKSVQSKRDLIKLNIERYKLLPRIYDKEYIEINIPEFSLKYYKDGVLLNDIFVVVGREDRPTPIFSDMLEYIVLNPAWIVPENLFRKDYLSHLITNPNSLLNDGIYVHKSPSLNSHSSDPSSIDWKQYLDENRSIPYYFIQYPGEKNVLGQMKFIFPNKYNVYLHDTNAKSLTTQKYRLYSSGCIRLSKPYELLSILSHHSKYSYDELIDLIESKKTVNVPLKVKIPIHIRYYTVFINEDLEVEFRRDFYGIDKLQMRAMRK